MSQHEKSAVMDSDPEAMNPSGSPEGTQDGDSHTHKVVFAVGPEGIYKKGDEQLAQWVGTHARPNRFGPQWLHQDTPEVPFQTVLDLRTTISDDLTPDGEEPWDELDSANTVWVAFADQRVAYIPRWKHFEVLTAPVDERVVSEHYYSRSEIALEKDGMWIISFHGMYWLPSESDDDQTVVLKTMWPLATVYIDHEGEASIAPETASDIQFSIHLLTHVWNHKTTGMYIESGVSGKAVIGIPDAQAIILIPGSVQPLSRPPFAQWNLLWEDSDLLSDTGFRWPVRSEGCTCERFAGYHQRHSDVELPAGMMGVVEQLGLVTRK
ncbi:hypothetical protein F5Y13DRAFT_163436 [Hypoxylon sp. FL1857]|nr:hypothetical protein F5Y13DRAFT_163436 [Hypoxylon sp. FL1857]